jgi:hypothetical protein
MRQRKRNKCGYEGKRSTGLREDSDCHPCLVTELAWSYECNLFLLGLILSI